MPDILQRLSEIWQGIAQFLIGNSPWLTPLLSIAVALGTLGRKFILRFAKQVLGKIDTRLEAKADELADWVVTQLERWVVKGWRLFSDRFQKHYYQQLIYDYRDYRTQGLKTKGPFALDLNKIFVPLRVAPESLPHVAATLLPVDSKAKSSFDIWEFIACFSSQPSFQRIAIIGPPGSGKTTLIEHIALTYAQGRQRERQRQAPPLIPIVLYLRELWEEIITTDTCDLATLIQHHPKIKSLNPPPHWFADKLGQGRCLVMLDGLDEVADAAFRRQVSLWVDQQMQRYPQTPFLITTRPFGYRSAPLGEIKTILEVQPFTLQQIEQFIQNWYLQNEIMRRLGKVDPGVRQNAQTQAQDLINRIKTSAPLATIALNPLLLTMIATVHNFRGALPGRRVELYGEICDVLLGRRQAAKGIANPLSAIQKKTILQVIALNRMKKKQLSFKTITGMLLIRERLKTVSGETWKPEAFLKHIENVSGLLVETEEGVYQFAHRSFQEYLAAVEIKDRNQELLLIRAIGNNWWEETIRLYAAQTDASTLIWAALQRRDHPDEVQALTLAYDCLEEGLSVQADIRKAVETTLEQGLDSPDLDLANLAAEVKLTRRLRQLVRIDNIRSIDTTLVSCAEYQQFIDERRLMGETRHPQHWSTHRFQPGMGQHPILGVLAKDAVAFCDWLTQRINTLGDFFLEMDTVFFMGNVKFRLPNQLEATAHPMDPTVPTANQSAVAPYWYEEHLYEAHLYEEHLLETNISEEPNLPSAQTVPLRGIRLIQERVNL